MAQVERSGLLDRTFFDRTLGGLRRAWRDVAGPGPTDRLAGRLDPNLPPEDADLVRLRIEACLSGRGGEVSARMRAADLGRAYLELDVEGRTKFLQILAREQGADREAVDKAMVRVRSSSDEEARNRAEVGLRSSLVPPRVKLFTQFNALPEGVKFLAELRADLLPLTKDDPDMAAMDRDLKDLLVSWFDVGFLDLARIHWQSPAALLEKLMAYEAVHEIRSWDDLKNRLDSDRRCFAFFHPRMPDEPLIFVEVALVNGMADNIHTLLDEQAPAQDPRTADTAVFYSISNCQRGLAGVSFGGFLIKRVVDDLTGYFPNLKDFVTLSPIPGFRAWLISAVKTDGGPGITAGESDALRALSGAESDSEALIKLLSDWTWAEDAKSANTLRGPLMRLCSKYLLEEKRKGKQAWDRVSHFHLSNGARVERINWLANLSSDGMEQSVGMMVNYRYKLSDIEGNHEAYRGDGKIAAAAAVRKLLKGG